MDPEKGTISLMDEYIQGIEPDKIVKKGITHVPEGREVFPILSVEENLKMGAYARTDKEKILDDLNLVYDYFPILRSCKHQQAGTLSGGQQQMMAIGRGLMARPKIMLLDEPSLGLSPLLTKDIFLIIKRLNIEQGVTMILVEQNAKVALNIANYGYVMELGRIVMGDKSEILLSSKDIQEFYLGQNSEASERGQKRWKQRKTWR
jgi:branched-chain amino acid transport system ATP-binding protein